MMSTTNNNLNEREDLADTDNDRVQDAGNADAAKFNADEQEQLLNDRQGDEDVEANDEHATIAENQGEKTQLEEELGGGTNLSLDQLKKEHDPQGE